MAKTLAEQLGPDTIPKFEGSAPRRMEEGDFLSKDHPLIVHGRTELGLPTKELAKDVRDRLEDLTRELDPDIRWQITEQVGRVIVFDHV